jgi:CP family cyanate transporter-like MFS transporter
VSPSSRPLWRGRTLALVGIVLLAFSLRSGVASLSPILDHVADDFALPAWVIGLIGTVPLVCFAAFGILTPQFERRLGLERLVVVALAVIGLAMVGRASAVDSLTLLLGTALLFAAVAVGNVVLPPLVKKYFPDRIGLLTTLFTTTMAVAAFLPPLVAVPTADAAGWRLSLGMWAVLAAASLVPWIALMVHARRGEDDDIEAAAPAVLRRMWRLPLAWALAVSLSVSSIIAYISFAWLPTILVDTADVTPATAGALLSLFAAMGLPMSLLVPVLVARYRIVRSLYVVAVVTGLLAVAGLLFAPEAAPWLWVALLGVAPLLFPLVLVLLGLRTRSPEASVALSGFVQSIGYAIAAVFPVAIGLLQDATDAWVLPLCVIAGVVAAAIPAGVVVARPHTIEDEWERRHGAWS